MVAEQVGVDRTTIGTWERGEYTPAPVQRPAYAAALGVTLEELDSLLTGIATNENHTPLWMSQFWGMEQSATSILTHEPHAVQGLLQTAEYAAAIARTVGVAAVSEAYVQLVVEQRRWRQARVLSGELALRVVQSEIALHLQIGDRATMAAQLDRLGELSRRANITVQIVPFATGQYEALRMGSVSIMSHPWVRGVSVYLIEHRGLATVEDPEEAANYVAAVEQAADRALTPKASRTLIEEMANRWRD